MGKANEPHTPDVAGIQSLSINDPSPSESATEVPQIRTVVTNKHGEKLVGILHDTGSLELVVVCHGFRSTKDTETIRNLASSLTGTGVAVLRFDFAGSGESEGSFQYRNYKREVEDLRSVMIYLFEKGYKVNAIIGHSQGGTVSLMYASTYGGIDTVINISGRFDVGGIAGQLGEEVMRRIMNDGFVDIRDSQGS